jgi:pimeloyl-ACP methyl ester carboxylesterase
VFLRRILILVVSVPLLVAALAQAASALQSAPCQIDSGFSCATLNVQLDRSGAVPGTVALSVERLQAGATPSSSAVVLLAGGPGQAALPLASETAKALAPALTTRDMLAFDQRGTGSSEPLQCSALEGAVTSHTIGGAFEQCALQIGARRGSYTTQESVADIEALRQAGGYQKLVLFGVSYGTKVALEYAERYPQNVEALVLDSVVPTDRVDPFSIATFQAMKPVFEELCSADACRGISTNPLSDIAHLTARMHKHALRGSVYDGMGRRHTAIMSDIDLLNLIDAGDLNPALRALLPASVQSALHGDPDPLLRLNLLSEGLIPNLPGTPTASAEGIDEALFVDTTCEEAPFPWQRAASTKTRLAEALAALRAQPISSFYPFTAGVEWQDNVLLGCAQWPNVAPAPPSPTPLPQVPTLILSGAQDLRTPTSGAEAVSARIPGAELIVVPFTGHSVLGTDFSGCAQKALAGFFSTGTALPCATVRNQFSPTPVTPTKLAYVKAIGGLVGKPGSTLAVVLDTILDLERQVIGATFEAEQELPSGSSFGGLRGGYARLTSSSLRLNRMSFVKGVQLTGTFPLKRGRLSSAELRVEGSQAARGTVRIGGSPQARGTLGGRRFDVSLAKVKLAGAGTGAGTGAGANAGVGASASFDGFSLGADLPVPALAHAG